MAVEWEYCVGMSDDFIEVIFLQVRFNRETSSETEK